MDRVLTNFVKVLRSSDIQASPAETLDAINVINAIGLNDKPLLRRSLSLTLAKTPQEKTEFYKCFDNRLIIIITQLLKKHKLLKNI